MLVTQVLLEVMLLRNKNALSTLSIMGQFQLWQSTSSQSFSVNNIILPQAHPSSSTPLVLLIASYILYLFI